jgi:hypothetical protein
MRKYKARIGDRLISVDSFGRKYYLRFLKTISEHITYNSPRLEEIKKIPWHENDSVFGHNKRYKVISASISFWVNEKGYIENYMIQLSIKKERHIHLLFEEELKNFSIGRHLLIEKKFGFYI